MLICINTEYIIINIEKKYFKDAVLQEFMEVRARKSTAFPPLILAH